jgi:hypothetical protein
MPPRIFWINLPAATLPLVLLFIILHLEKSDRNFREQIKSMDWFGILLVSAALVGILYATLSGGAVSPWSSPGIIASMVLGLVALTGFILYEAFVAGIHFGGEPLIPLRVFGTRTAAIGYSMVMLHSVVWCSMAFSFPIYVRLPSIAKIFQLTPNNRFSLSKVQLNSARDSKCCP